MGFGNLDRRIVIQSRSVSSLANGEPSISWSTYHTCWAGLDYGSDGEGYDGDQLTASNTIMFKIRYKSGLNETMRISYNSAYWDITHIEEVGRQRFLILKAEKKD